MTRLNFHVSHFEDRAQAERHYLDETDRLAEAERGKYITVGAGQAMTYEAKVREARAGEGPMIEAEAEALEMTVEEVAATVLASHDQWQTACAHIEAVRLKAKKQVRGASTAADMHAAVKALSEELTP